MPPKNSNRHPCALPSRRARQAAQLIAPNCKSFATGPYCKPLTMGRSRTVRRPQSHRPVTYVQHSANAQTFAAVSDRCIPVGNAPAIEQGYASLILIRQLEDSFVKRSSAPRRLAGLRAGHIGMVQFPAADRAACVRRQRPAADEPRGVGASGGDGPHVAAVVVGGRVHARRQTPGWKYPGRKYFECGDLVEHRFAPSPRVARQRSERTNRQLGATADARAAAAGVVVLKLLRQCGAGCRRSAA
jgi:hypothetical protein